MDFDENKVISYKNKYKAIVGKKYYYSNSIEALSDNVKEEMFCGVLERTDGPSIRKTIINMVTREPSEIITTNIPFRVGNLFWEYIYPAEEDYSVLEME